MKKTSVLLSIAVILVSIVGYIEYTAPPRPALKFLPQVKAVESLEGVPVPVMLALIDMSLQGQPLDTATNNIFKVMEDSVIIKYTYPAASIRDFAERMRQYPDFDKNKSPTEWADFLFTNKVVSSPYYFLLFHQRYENVPVN